MPERELIAEFLGRADDIIDTPTPAQQMLYGPKRRRVPAIWDVDTPVQTGVVQNQDAYMQAVAAQRPYFFDHIAAITEPAWKNCRPDRTQLQRVATFVATMPITSSSAWAA